MTSRTKTVGVVTTSRADYGIYRPVLRALNTADDFDVRLIVSGTHLLEAHGRTVRFIEEDGFAIAARLDVMESDDSPRAVATTMGRATQAFAETFAGWQPDFLMVLGDRFEMHAAAVAALPFRIPVVHLHGGELSEGAIDDSLRHSMTKLSHLHCVATEPYRQRVIQLGESPWRVTVTGAPGLDNIREFDLLDRAEFADEHGFELSENFLLVTFHPVTLEVGDNLRQVDELLTALDRQGLPVVVTMPNADTDGQRIWERLQSWSEADDARIVVKSLGVRGYFSAMNLASAMVGNSSSGLIEAPSFGLPVVNVGTRQDGRIRGANVIDVPCEADAIVLALRRALDPDFRAGLDPKKNPYGTGNAAQRIVEVLRSAPEATRLIRKSFHDLPTD